MADLMFSLGQTKGIKKTKAKVKDTRDKLKDVKITETVETNSRKEHHVRDIHSKEVARDQIKKNMDVNITGSSFCPFDLFLNLMCPVSSIRSACISCRCLLTALFFFICPLGMRRDRRRRYP